MKIFTGGRRCGKTQKAIEWAAENDAYIVCSTFQDATRIFRRAKEQGIKIRFPITFDELTDGGLLGAGVEGLVFDNVDLLLARLARGKPVVGFTATGKA